MSVEIDIKKDTIIGGRTGRATIGTSAVQIADKAECISGIEIRADTNNTGVIYVGYKNTVTADADDQTDGFPLYATDSKHFPVESPDKLWLIASAVSQKVWWDAK